MCESADDSEDELFDEDDADHYYRMSDIENEIDYLQGSKANDPEYFEYECLPIEEVEKIWNTSVEEICKSLSVSPSRAKVRTELFSYSIELGGCEQTLIHLLSGHHIIDL